MEGACRRSACSNAHGFAEIRDAMNDASPICWRWLEGRCHIPHCKYAHTFRRHHASQRSSFDNGRSSFARSRNSGDSRRGSFHTSSNARRSVDRRRPSFSSACNGARDPNQLDGPADHMAALDSALTRQAKLPIRPVHARKSMDRSYANDRSFNNERSFNDAPVRPWVAMARASAAGNGKSGLFAGDGRGRMPSSSGHGSSGSGDENVNGKMSGSGGKSWCNALLGKPMPNGSDERLSGKGRPAATFASRVAAVSADK